MGKRLEVCWPYKEGSKTDVKIWASGTVKRIADGLTDTASARAKKILPAGALLWAWDADPTFDEVAGEKWLILLPNRRGIGTCSTPGASILASWLRRAAKSRRQARLESSQTCQMRSSPCHG